MTVGYKVVRDTWYYDWRRLVEAAPELRQYTEPNYNEAPVEERITQARHCDNNTLRTQGLNEDEVVLAAMVSNHDTSTPPDTHTSLDYERPYISDTFHQAEWEACTDIYPHNFECDNLFKGIGDPGVPLLPIPRCFLWNHSEVWSGENTKYSLHSSRGDICSASKIRFSHRGKFLRFVHASYYFNKKKNFMSEQREFFKCLSFNLETNKAYFTTYDKKPVFNKTKRKANKYIKRLECRNVTPSFLRLMPESIELIVRFTRALLEDTKHTIPGVVIPIREHSATKVLTEIEYLRYLISAIVLQRRVGQPLPWVRNICTLKIVYKLWDFADLYSILANTFADVYSDRKPTEKKYKPKYMYKIHSNLKKKPTLKTFFTTILGHFATKSVIKYLTMSATHLIPYRSITNNDNIVESIVGVASLLTRGILPTEAVHLIKLVVDDMSSIQNARNELSSCGFSFINDAYSAMSYKRIINNAHLLFSCIKSIYSRDNQPLEKRYLESFIKFLRRMWNTGELSDNIRWTTWRDTFNMAEQLSLRIRPNKFKNFDEARLLHDQLAVIQRRDISNKNELGHIYFLPCFCPQEEFDGFRFVQLTHVDDLIAEGRAMHHCVGGYGYQCATGDSIIFSMWKDRSYVTIELSGKSLEIRQQYTINDNLVINAKILELIDRWHNRLLYMHRKDQETYRKVANRFYNYQKMPSAANTFVHIDGIDLSDVKRKYDELAKEFEGLNIGRSGLYGGPKPTKVLPKPCEVEIPETIVVPQTTAPRPSQSEAEVNPFCEEFIHRLEEMEASNG